MSFAGKVALVTGASRGIGEAVARTLGGEGATVFVHYKQRGEDARRVAEAIARDGGAASRSGRTWKTPRQWRP